MTLSPSSTRLQALLAELARHFGNIETSTSADEIFNCYRHLSVLEISALNRLFLLLYHGKQIDANQISTTPLKRTTLPGYQQYQPRLPPRAQNVQREIAPSSGAVATSMRAERTRYDRQSSHHRRGQQIEYQTPVLDFFDCQMGTDVSLISPQLRQEPTMATVDDYIGSEACTKTMLASCTEIKFKPTTLQLLKRCKHQPGDFLHCVKECKAVLPTGHGWEAAIAIKKDNADVRDLIKIYHRFECYNIYKHVVEAGFHTGEHWIRSMRTALIEKLCRDFPERFRDAKTANKCQNWVDQGCRYHEWAQALSGQEADLGYLIALPSDIPHSAYTWRCTKEQIVAAAARFKKLGITMIVHSLKLSALGAHISGTLKEMTTRKGGRSESIPQPRTSTELSLQPEELVLAMQTSDNATLLPAPMTQCILEGSIGNSCATKSKLVQSYLDTHWQPSGELGDAFMGNQDEAYRCCAAEGFTSYSINSADEHRLLFPDH